jgi:hypothetical protein
LLSENWKGKLKVHKMIRCLVAATALAAAGVAGSANAAAIIVNPWQSSGNGTIKNDDFGTVPNMDLLFSGTDALGASVATDRMYVYALWGTLSHVSYTYAAVADVFLRPDAGWTQGVSLYSFEVGSYLGSSQSSEVRIYNGDFTSLLFHQSYQLGDNAVTISPNLSSLDGLHIQFSGTPGRIAIDNIAVEAGQVFATAVPEPSTWALMIVGFAGIGFAAYRRSLKDQGLALAGVCERSYPSRMITVRLSPPRRLGGINGSTSFHSSSVRSLG